MTISADLDILVVDDDESLRRLTCNHLRSLGFIHIRVAADGAAALEMLRDAPAALIISDWDMAPMDGLELLSAVRDDENLKSIPLIMATAKNGSDDRAAARKAGVDGYVVKPFSAATLKLHIKRALVSTPSTRNPRQ